MSRAVKDLSHPAKQLLEVIANLDSNARFPFLDEPTTALDGQQSAELLAHVRRIALEQQIGIVLVSHKLDEVLGGQRLKSVDLEARRGEILGLYGLVGSGRTRFLRTLYGAEPQLRGLITLAGRDYRPVSPGHAIAEKLAFLTEERKIDGFIPLMNAYQNVVLSTLRNYRKGGLVNLSAARASAAATLSRIGTHGRLDRPVKSLSGGNQQKVLLGRIIEQNANLILLDEPTKGVDIGAKGDIYDIIRRLADEERCIIVVSSEEEELIEICDRIAIFRDGCCDGAALPVADWTLGKLREAAWAHAA